MLWIKQPSLAFRGTLAWPCGRSKFGWVTTFATGALSQVRARSVHESLLRSRAQLCEERTRVCGSTASLREDGQPQQARRAWELWRQQYSAATSRWLLRELLDRTNADILLEFCRMDMQQLGYSFIRLLKGTPPYHLRIHLSLTCCDSARSARYHGLVGSDYAAILVRPLLRCAKIVHL